MPDVIAFMLKLDVVGGQGFSRFANIGKGIAENIGLRPSNIIFFPVVFETVVAIGERMERRPGSSLNWRWLGQALDGLGDTNGAALARGKAEELIAA